MKLLITDPMAVVAQYDDVESLRAEDESGGFGILPGHADFLTALTMSVVSWRHSDGRHGYCAVHRGVLTVHGGHEIAIATREAERGDDPIALAEQIQSQYRGKIEMERSGRVAALRLHTQAVRRIVDALRGDRSRTPVE